MVKKKQHMQGNLYLWKLEAADYLGYGDKLRISGWGGLTARETGLIGAAVKKIKKSMTE